MKTPNPRLWPTEIAMIELMKLDDKFADYHEDVDMSVPFDVRESYNAAPEQFLPRLLAERAKLYCRKKMKIPVDEVEEKWTRWVVILSVFLLCSFLFFAILTAIGVPAMFFSGEKREVSVLWVSMLIGVMALLCFIPLVSLVSLIVQRLMGRPQAVVADVILWIIGSVRDRWASLRGLPLPSQQATPNRFAALFGRNSYFLSAISIFLSNLYFVLMGIAIWGVLWLFLFSRNVNYVHESSLSTAEERASFIETAGWPVQFITGTPAPGPMEMRWAGGSFVFDEKTFVYEEDGVTLPWSKDEIETHKNLIVENFRRAWSCFLLSSVWTWVFLPRVAVAVIASGCMVWFYRDFLPTHAEPVNRLIVDHIRTRRSQVQEVAVEQVDDTVPENVGADLPKLQSSSTLLASTESKTILLTPSQSHDPPNSELPSRHSADAASATNPVGVTKTDSPPTVEMAPSQPRPKSYAIVGFGLGSIASGATTRLAKLEKECQDYGNLNGATPQLRFRSVWKGDECANISLVVLASLTSVPTVSFGSFISDLVATARSRSSSTQSAIQIVLTDGKETRERLGSDPDVFETRVSQWIGRIVEAGVNRSNIFEFDASTDAGASAVWTALKPSSPPIGSHHLKIAGKIKEAVSIVRRHFAEVFESDSLTYDHDWTEQLRLISTDLGKLYRDQSEVLLQFLNAKKCSDTVKAAISSCELPSGITPEVFQILAKCTELFETVSSKWIVGGALGGLGLGAVVGVALVATGGLAAIPLSVLTVITSPFGGAVVGQVVKTLGFSTQTEQKSNQLAQDSVNDMVAEAEQTLQASILQIIVLELQGNTESEITKQLREQTQRLDHHQVRNMNDIEVMLNDFQLGMSAIGEQS